MKRRKAIIRQACVTVEGDRFPGNEYSGEGVGELVRAGLAEWADAPEAGEPEASGGSDGEGRVYCQIEGCRRYGAKLVKCPDCEQETCPDHMDPDGETCIPCADEAAEGDDSGGEGEE